MTARHELHWNPTSQEFSIVALHPMEEDECGWIGRPCTDEEMQKLLTYLRQHDPEVNDTLNDGECIDEVFRDAWSAEAEVDGVHYRMSEGEVMVVENWCMLAQASLWGVAEMIDGAKWTGPDDATIPVVEIVDFGFEEGPIVHALGPLVEDRLEAELLTLRTALVGWDFAGDGNRSKAESTGHSLRDQMVDYLCAKFDPDRPYIAVDHLIGLMGERWEAGDKFLYDVIPENYWGLRTEGEAP